MCEGSQKQRNHLFLTVLCMLCHDTVDMLQTVHFIRHGEGFHNIGFDGNLDAHLTPTGWEQAHALNRHIRQLQPPLDIQVGLLKHAFAVPRMMKFVPVQAMFTKSYVHMLEQSCSFGPTQAYLNAGHCCITPGQNT